MQTPSPLTALTMLLLYKQRRVSLTLEDYETYIDTVVSVLEDVNNEKYRLEE